jgi:hypothetical protein
LESSNLRTMTPWCPGCWVFLCVCVCGAYLTRLQESGKLLKSQRLGVLVDILVCQWIFC